jgi:hypothetical protein
MRTFRKRIIIHCFVIITIYLAFLVWHGAFEGRLTEDEIWHYATLLSEQNPGIEKSEIAETLKSDTGSPIYMVNLVKLRDQPLAIKEASYQSHTSQQLYEHYSRFVGGFLLKHGSYPVFLGLANGKAASAWGMGSDTEWTSAVVVRYRSLRTLLELATHPEFRKWHEFKFAAVEKTLAYPTTARLHLAHLDLLVLFLLLVISFLQLAGPKLLKSRKSG